MQGLKQHGKPKCCDGSKNGDRHFSYLEEYYNIAIYCTLVFAIHKELCNLCRV